MQLRNMYLLTLPIYFLIVVKLFVKHWMLTGYAELSKLKLSIILKSSPARLPVRSCPAILTVQRATEVRSQCFDLDNLIDQQFVRPFFSTPISLPQHFSLDVFVKWGRRDWQRRARRKTKQKPHNCRLPGFGFLRFEQCDKPAAYQYNYTHTYMQTYSQSVVHNS